MCIPINVYSLTSFPGPYKHITYSAGNEATGQLIIIHDSLIPRPLLPPLFEYTNMESKA